MVRVPVLSTTFFSPIAIRSAGHAHWQLVGGNGQAVVVGQLLQQLLSTVDTGDHCRGNHHSVRGDAQFTPVYLVAQGLGEISDGPTFPLQIRLQDVGLVCVAKDSVEASVGKDHVWVEWQIGFM